MYWTRSPYANGSSVAGWVAYNGALPAYSGGTTGVNYITDERVCVRPAITLRAD